MTEKQREQFNTMRFALKRIARDYQTTKQLEKNSEKQYGLDYHEALEGAYENIQQEAQNAIKNVRRIPRR